MLNTIKLDRLAAYLVEECGNREQFNKDDDLKELFIKIYKKGYHDCSKDLIINNDEIA